MDSLTFATTFATLISLIADFKAHRAEGDSRDYEEFARYAASRRHDELLTLLNRNTEATLGIKTLLREDRQTLGRQLVQLDTALASLASRIAGFGALVSALHPGAELSTQAVSILRQFQNAGASKALDTGMYGRSPVYLLMDGRQGELVFDDVQFVSDDFARLADLGLLRIERNSGGRRVYVFTREAARLLSLAQPD